MRLHRFLASAGVDSRRNCEEYIQQGRVTVDNEPVTELGTVIDPETQKVRLDGELIRAERKQYYVLNKPKGYICTNRDPQGRPRAVDLISARSTRLFTVGRLDENSEGLILVTNDGELANRLAHPRYRIRRVYRVQVAGIPKQETLRELQRGLRFKEGMFRFRSIRRLRKSQGKSSFLEVELTEGRNREIRRLFARAGHKVMQLERVSFGPIRLGSLGSGKNRPLLQIEVQKLQELLNGEDARPRRPNPRNSQSRRPHKSGSARKSNSSRKTNSPQKRRPR